MVSCPNCERNQRMAKGAMIDAENLEVDLRAARRRIKDLEKRLDTERKADPQFEAAREVFEYWTTTQKNPERCLFTADRQRKLIARLNEGHTIDELKEAIDGAAVGAFEKDGVRYDSISTIFKGGDSVRLYRQKARANKIDGSNLSPTQLVTKITEMAGAEPGFSERLGTYEWDPCPVCQEATLTLSVNGSMRFLCGGCGADETRLRAFVASNDRRARI